MGKWILAAFVSLGLAVVVLAQEPPAKTDESTPQTASARFEALQKEFEEAMQRFVEVYQKAEGEEAQRKAFEECYPKPDEFAPRFLAIAREFPKDPVAVEALTWVVSNSQASPAADEALEILARDHVTSDQVEDVCATLAFSRSPGAEKFLRAVLEKNPKHEVQGKACFSLAENLKGIAEIIQQYRSISDKAELEGPREYYGGERFDALLAQDPAEFTRKAEGLFERAAKEFADVSVWGDRTIGSMAESALFEMRNLAIGKVAPEIEGEGVDGVPMKLSDFRGKVVVLDFWGDW